MTRKTTQPKTKKADTMATSRAVRLLLAAYILVMLLAQLFTFERFPELLEMLGLSSGWAVLLVIVELLALPFLLGMKMPVGVLQVSVGCGAATLVLLSAMEWMAYEHGISILFGATIELPGGAWALLFLAALWVLFAWSVWDSVYASWKRLVLPKARKVVRKTTKPKKRRAR